MCCGGHEPSREEKTQVSRRRMVKAMGAGAGLVTLGGLTGCTQLLDAESGVLTGTGDLKALGLRRVPNRRLIQATLNQWRKVVRVNNGIEHVPQPVLKKRVSKAIHMSERLISETKESGYDSWITDKLRNLPNETLLGKETRNQFISKLEGAFTDEQLSRLDFSLGQKYDTDVLVQPIIKHGGWANYYKNIIDHLDQENPLEAQQEQGDDDEDNDSSTCRTGCSILLAAGFTLCAGLGTSEACAAGGVASAIGCLMMCGT